MEKREEADYGEEIIKIRRDLYNVGEHNSLERRKKVRQLIKISIDLSM